MIETVGSNNGNQTIKIDGTQGQILLGGYQHSGIFMCPATAKPTDSTWNATIRLHTALGSIYLGGNGTNGTIALYPSGVQNIGQNNGQDYTIMLNGNTGDITLRGADCAEYFAVAEPKNISPGTVLIAESEDVLIPSQNPYDKRVIGVVSGGGDYKPGILLGKDLKEQGLPIALNGKVYCNVDTSNGAIGVGDLLTTSSILGHAMKADDPAKSFGAIIGKALKPLTEGKGLIPILVALQ